MTDGGANQYIDYINRKYRTLIKILGEKPSDEALFNVSWSLYQYLYLNKKR